MLSERTKDLINRLLTSNHPEQVAIGELLDECADTDDEAADMALQLQHLAAQLVEEIRHATS